MKYDLQPEVLAAAEQVMREHGIEDFSAFVRFSMDGLVIDGELSLAELRCLVAIAEHILPGHGVRNSDPDDDLQEVR